MNSHSNSRYNIAIVGATGNVGREILSILHERSFPIQNIYLLASDNSIGKILNFGNQSIYVQSIVDFNFENIDIAFFAAGSKVSEQYVPVAIKSGATIIDKSDFFRFNADVPLIVPEINRDKIKNSKIIASPNCVVVPLALILEPLDRLCPINRVVASTYQSVSGAGKAAMDELYQQTKAKYVFDEIESIVFQKKIAFNLIPCIGSIGQNGISSEESKIMLELTKILGSHTGFSITCVRVPTFISHAISLNIQFQNNINISDIYDIINNIKGVRVHTDTQFMSPLDVTSSDDVHISRLRIDTSAANAFNAWIISDNLRKGAALNAVQIAEIIINTKIRE